MVTSPVDAAPGSQDTEPDAGRIPDTQVSPEAATPSGSPSVPSEDRPVLERFFSAAQRGNVENLGTILMGADETLDLAAANEVNCTSNGCCDPVSTHVLNTIRSIRHLLPSACPPQDGYSALHLAASADHMGVVKLLLIHGASPHLPSLQTKQTALHVAAKNGNIDVAVLLVAQYGVPLGTLDAVSPTGHPHLGASRIITLPANLDS